jgi:hypothetical protein
MMSMVVDRDDKFDLLKSRIKHIGCFVRVLVLEFWGEVESKVITFVSRNKRWLLWKL